MRQVTTAARVREFMRRLGRTAPRPLAIFLTGGTSAVLEGWRDTTVDIDLRLEREDDDVLRAMVSLKATMDVNVELASPEDFIPALPGWRDRSRFITQEGRLSFYHYDFYGQALSKIERGHAKDIEDARQMVTRDLIETPELVRLFGEIEPFLFRYPALDPQDFRARVERFVADEKEPLN